MPDNKPHVNPKTGEPRKFTNEVKRHFLEIVSTYSKYQEMMDRKSDIIEVANTLGGITEAARELAINEADGWFDKHTVKRNMDDLDKLGKQFDKVATEAKALDQRMVGLYEDMGHILSRYYKVGEITEDQVKSRLGIKESINEGVMKDIHLIAKKVKNEKQFIDAFMKKYGNKVKSSPDTNQWLVSLYKDVVKESINEQTKSRTIKYPTSKGTLHLEIEEDAAGVIVDIIFNKIELVEADIQFPTGNVVVKHKKKRVNLSESVNEARQTYSKPNAKAKKQLKGMFKLKAVQFAQGHNFYYYDKGKKKWWFVDVDGDLMELRNDYTLGKMNDYIQKNQININESKKPCPCKESINEDQKKVWKKGKGLFVDSDFVNFSKGKLPNSELKHAGMGDFFLDTPLGKVYFIRTSDKFDGMNGRAHRITDNEQNGKLIAQLIKKMGAKIINESVNEDKLKESSEYDTSSSSNMNNHNNEYKLAEKLNKGNEIKFYDELDKIEDKLGHNKFMIWLSKALKGYKVDMSRNPKIKNPSEAQEALFNLSK